MAFSFPTGVERRTDCLSMILGEDIAAQEMLAWRLEPGEVGSRTIRWLRRPRPWDNGSVFAHGTFALDPIDGLWKGWQALHAADDGATFENFRRVTLPGI